MTPDSVRDKIEFDIINDLLSGDLGKVTFKKYIKLTASDVTQIYSNFLNKWFFKALLNCLTSGPSLLCQISTNRDDILKIMNQRKGKFHLKDNMLVRSGLRLKYGKKFSNFQIENSFYNEKCLFEIFEFRIHTPDNETESELLHSLIKN